MGRPKLEHPKQIRCFRLSKKELDALDDIKKKCGLEKDTEAIRLAILQYAAMIETLWG